VQQGLTQQCYASQVSALMRSDYFLKPVFLCTIDLFSTPNQSQPLKKIENLKTKNSKEKTFNH